MWHILRKVYDPDLKMTVYRAGTNELPTTRGRTVVGGHFSLNQSKQIAPNAQVISMVRDPLDRVISEVYRNMRFGRYTGPAENPVLWHVQNNGKSIMRDMLEDLDGVHVGIFEQYNESLRRFAEVLGWDSIPNFSIHNIGVNRVEPGHDEKLMILEHLQDEYDLYDECVERFNA